MVGMARKNENSAAERLSVPSSMAPTMVAPERDTPGIMARHWMRPILKASDGRDSPSRRCSARASCMRSTSTSTMPPTISMTAISIGVSNSTVLMKSCAKRADHRRRQERQQHAEHEAARARIVRQRHGDARQLDGVDAEDGEDGAELDQHLERLAGRADAEEVLGEQKVAGRRDGKELGQPLDEAQAGSLPRSASAAP